MSFKDGGGDKKFEPGTRFWEDEKENQDLFCS